MPDNAEATPPPAAARVEASPSPLSPTGFSNHAIHLVRTAQTINLTLSQMADAKASILMGATFLVFTIAVGQSKTGSIPPALGVLAFFAFLSALCAVLAVLPSISTPKKNIASTAPNKLFFGFFTAIPEDEWVDSVIEDLRSDEKIFRVMLHDVYQNGQVMQRKKYRYLGIAYRIFMVGLCATVLTFAVQRALIVMHTP